MRLEVLVGLEDPLIFPLDRPRIILGSGEGADIIINADGISRRHILITFENDQHYITDQGSTNGSFVNEEKLTPGKKTEFTSFFPVRLGSETLLSLLSDEEVFEEEASNPAIVVRTPEIKSFPREESVERSGTSELTRVISLKDLKRAKTDELIKQRDEKRLAKKKKPKKKKKDSNAAMWIGVLILLGAAYFNLIHDRKEQRVAATAKPAEEIIKEEKQIPVESTLVEEDFLPKKDFFQELLPRDKCTIDTEMYLCQAFQVSTPPFGAMSIGLTNYVFINAESYYQEAIQLLGERHGTPEAIRDVAGYIFLFKNVPELDLGILKESRLMIGLFRQNEGGGYSLENIIAFKPKTFNENKANITAGPFRSGRGAIHNSLFFTRSIYQIY